ncbi:Nif3-like dinuclear metal center hexameric protein [Gracilibacillus sp. YIM 98692]|uniref:Nif3-like dinuclear metal center hexameric protein n=1 Tax=Gracilibacillus sp. YIM 98692 TaxID=2663532 RepID=UPI0013D376B6|nr:Nif3-like dinuclear metal center hexameric protein [Gracilibacillus sp. YIM 98692]
MRETVVRDVIQLFENWVPKSYAESWDNVGLQIGDMEKPVKRLMITLDVVEKVVDEAIDKKADMIIAHHPLFFESLKSINLNSPKGKVIAKLMKHQISVYTAHTNLDIAEGGVNDLLAEKLELRDTKVLVPTKTDHLLKFIAYVPHTHVDSFKEAIGNAGAGHIGNYSHCTFQSEGKGAFKPLSGTNPFIGTQGEIEQVNEYKVETIIKESQLEYMIQVAQEAHPYEEMAYDIVPLQNKGKVNGLGRYGKIDKKMNLEEYVEVVKKAYQVPFVRFVGNKEKTVKKVAILGGSGKGFIKQAQKVGADLYITGDLTFHDAQDAEQAGISLIDPGHHIEEVMKKGVQSYFQQNKKNLPSPIEVEVSDLTTEPFQWG